jgi:uncharacterized protein (DUF488 family)
VEVYSIGFGGHAAPEFFGKLDANGIERLIDVRLNNVSQLAGFTKRSDLPFFLKRLSGIEYAHDLELAPTSEMLAAYRARKMPWVEYASLFKNLLAERQVERLYDEASLRRHTVFLCSEPTARQCHRRLVLEYIKSHGIPSQEPIHL